MTKLIIAISLATLLIASPTAEKAPEPVKLEGAMVRLHEASSGKFFCSGTIVSNTLILTAAHCIANMPKGAPAVSVRTSDGRDVGVKAQLASFEQRSDQGMLRGDFRKFAKRPMALDIKEILDVFTNPKSQLVTCGFPYGGKLVCTRFHYTEKAGFQMSGTGFIYPGMSGGPVIDLGTGKIIAVNTAVEGKWVIVSPLIELFPNLDLHVND